MKKVIFLCIVIAIVIIIAGVNPTTVDYNTVMSYIVLAMFISVCVWFVSILTIDMWKDHKDTKLREAKEAERLALRNKYAHLSKGLTMWLGDALLQVKWCEYSKDFHINYEHPWKMLCVRGHIGIDGTRKELHTIPGYKFDFLNESDRISFDNALHTLIGRIEDTNAGILFESK